MEKMRFFLIIFYLSPRKPAKIKDSFLRTISNFQVKEIENKTKQK